MIFGSVKAAATNDADERMDTVRKNDVRIVANVQMKNVRLQTEKRQLMTI